MSHTGANVDILSVLIYSESDGERPPASNTIITENAGILSLAPIQAMTRFLRYWVPAETWVNGTEV
jgi:hypothetical protein